jgi:hypothetical protein
MRFNKGLLSMLLANCSFSGFWIYCVTAKELLLVFKSVAVWFVCKCTVFLCGVLQRHGADMNTFVLLNDESIFKGTMSVLLKGKIDNFNKCYICLTYECRQINGESFFLILKNKFCLLITRTWTFGLSYHTGIKHNYFRFCTKLTEF